MVVVTYLLKCKQINPYCPFNYAEYDNLKLNNAVPKCFKGSISLIRFEHDAPIIHS